VKKRQLQVATNLNWQTDISEQRTVVFEFKESSNKSTNLKTLEELLSKLTEFTEELVKSSQKFPSNLKRSKKTNIFCQIRKGWKYCFQTNEIQEKIVNLKNFEISVKNPEIFVRHIKTDQEN
jgi:hypothetical protein